MSQRRLLRPLRKAASVLRSGTVRPEIAIKPLRRTRSFMEDAETMSTASSCSYSFRKRRRPSISSSDGTGSPASSIRTGQKENLRLGEVCRTLRSGRQMDAPLTPVNQVTLSTSVEDEEEETPPRSSLSRFAKRAKRNIFEDSTDDIVVERTPIKRVTRNHLNQSIEEVVINTPKLEGVSNTSQMFSPSKMTLNKVQEARLKRLTARIIEMDPDIFLEMSSQSITESQNSSLLNTSIADPAERLMDLCKQSDIKVWSDLFDEEILDCMVKLGEGVYGEVFQSPKGNVIKIFPFEGDQLVNGEKQMTYDEVFPEVFISNKMTELGYKHRNDRSCNFVQLRKSTVVKGLLPHQFVDVWKQYATAKGTDNENLDFLPADQLWMVLEFDFAGEPLGKFRFTTCREAQSVILQLAISLAAAESALQFEHRDLHWLNVLVKTTRQSKLRYRVGGIGYSVMTQGVQVSIIDFTVSRLLHEGNTVYVDMSDSPEIFEGEGDYQFEIYRMMRDNCNHKWRLFKPETNLYWLHYLMDKLLTETSYPRRDPDSVAVESELRALYDCVLSGSYKSAQDLVHNNFYFDMCRIDSVSSDND